MKAVVVTAAGKTPIYTDFTEPVASPGMQVVAMHAAALTNLTKGRASGSHYSADATFPAVAGVDGVGMTQDGRRVYFALPAAPFGALAERCLVDARHCIEVPHALDSVTAAALGNPGMSAWAALVERAHLVAGETVLINGATGAAGRVAVQLARYLGAGRVIATGRNAEELESLKEFGADIVIPFALAEGGAAGAKAFGQALEQAFASGVHVVVDYLWGQSARIIMASIVKTIEDGTPVRFVSVGEAAGESEISLPSAALRSSPMVLMGSGLKSVALPVLLASIGHVFAAAGSAGLQIPIQVMPLSSAADAWSAKTKARIVFTMS